MYLFRVNGFSEGLLLTAKQIYSQRVEKDGRMSVNFDEKYDVLLRYCVEIFP